jgi:hypothetical protein
MGIKSTLQIDGSLVHFNHGGRVVGCARVRENSGPAAAAGQAQDHPFLRYQMNGHTVLVLHPEARVTADETIAQAVLCAGLRRLNIGSLEIGPE